MFAETSVGSSRRGGSSNYFSGGPPAPPAAPFFSLPVPTQDDVRRQKRGLAEGENLAPFESNTVGKREAKLIAQNVATEQSKMDIYDFEAIQFSVMSAETIRKISEVHCTDQNAEGIYTVNSARLGTVERNVLCLTCNQPEIDCVGHMGHMDFHIPIPHPLMIEYIVNTLQSVCSNCGRLLLPEVAKKDPGLLRFKGPNRLKEIANRIRSSNTITCSRNLEIAERNRLRKTQNNSGGILSGTSASKSVVINPPTIKKSKSVVLPSEVVDEVADEDDDSIYCHSIIPKYSGPINAVSTKDYHIRVSYKTKSGKEIPPQRVPIEDIARIFDAIPSEDLAIMGFSGDSHPRNFIMRALPIIPPRAIPPIFRDGQKKYDHITYFYRDNIRNMQKLQRVLERKNNGATDTENEITNLMESIYDTTLHLFNNTDGSYKIRKTDPARTIGQILSGKDGLCRGYAQAKRVDQCGRSVIGPGVVPFGAIITPGAMRFITIPERVTFINIDRIRKQVKAGEIIHITRARGPLAKIKMRLPLEIANAEARGEPAPDVAIGDLIERLSGIGEDVFVNRQPTLHRYSMIGVVSIPRLGKKNIGLHMSYTPGMNADFDGDESNVCFPQTIRARAETRHLLGVQNHIISSHRSAPINGLVFNAPVAVYLLCKDHDEDPRTPFISEILYDQIVKSLLLDDTRARSLPARLQKNGIAPRTPRAIFSLTLPEDFYYRRDDVYIREGVLVRGIMKAADVKGALIQAIWLRYGPHVTTRFITEGTFILDFYIERRGFSIGINDCLLADRKAASEKIREIVAKAKLEIEQVKSSKPETQFEADAQELQICMLLNKAKKDTEYLSKGEIMGENNPLAVMVNSGGKGKASNVAEIAGIIGQQFVNSQRPAKVLYGNRTLPYYPKDDDSIEANGFASKSWNQGIDVDEQIHHLAGSRVCLLDTSLRTADVGTINHRCIKMLENERLAYNGGVLNTSWMYNCLSYGEGYTPLQLTLVKEFPSTGHVYMPYNIAAIVDELNNTD